MQGMWSLVGIDGAEVGLHELSVRVHSVAGSGSPRLQTSKPLTIGNGQAFRRSYGNIWQPRLLKLELTPQLRGARTNSIRRALLLALQPELANETTPAWLKYHEGDNTLTLPVVYMGGLEDTDEGSQKLTVELASYDPIWQEIATVSPQTLATNASVEGDRIWQQAVDATRSGSWRSMGIPGGAVSVLRCSKSGMLIAGGNFGTGPHIQKWNESNGAWEAIGTGSPTGSGAYVQTAVWAADGSLYVGGYLNEQVARFDGFWHALPLTDSSTTLVDALALGQNGELYASGYFTGTLSGSEVVSNVAVYDGNTWSALPGIDAGISTRVRALAVGLDGRLYAGGDFDTPGGSNGHVAVWDSTCWSALGEGLDGTVYCLLTLSDGRIAAGGNFSGGVAIWNGMTWQVLGNLGASPLLGNTVCVYTLAEHPDSGLLYAGGHFDKADGLYLADRGAMWNGFRWSGLDATLPVGDISAALVGTDGTLTVGGGGSGTATVAGITKVVNSGSAITYPIVTLSGPARVYELTNWTTGARIAFDLEILAGEVVTIDFRPQSRSISSPYRGTMPYVLVGGSDIAGWHLVPGDNLVGLLMLKTSGVGTPSATIKWHNREVLAGSR